MDDQELELPELRGTSKENYNPLKLENIETLKNETKRENLSMALPNLTMRTKQGWHGVGVRSTRNSRSIVDELNVIGSVAGDYDFDVIKPMTTWGKFVPGMTFLSPKNGKERDKILEEVELDKISNHSSPVKLARDTCAQNRLSNLSSLMI